MSSDELSQAEADSLLAMEKHRISDVRLLLPDLGGKLSVELQSVDKRERFYLDTNRSSIKLTKFTVQTRARVITILARLDVDGAPHRNPDDVEVPCPHLHLYRQGYGDKWAYPATIEHFRNLSNRWVTLQDFMRYCHITKPPDFERGLFS
jgi:hypothetical protein